VFIENDVVLGDAVTVKSGVQLWDGVRLGNRVFVGPNATLTNDRFPRSKQYPARFLETTIEDEASVGANATILPGVRIGYGAMIGAGAVVVNGVPARAVAAGNPSRVVGYAGAVECGTAEAGRLEGGEFGARLISFQDCSDSRGAAARSREKQSCVPAQAVLHGRSGHPRSGARRPLPSPWPPVMIAVAGEMKIALDDGRNARVVCLNDPHLGLYVPLVDPVRAYAARGAIGDGLGRIRSRGLHQRLCDIHRGCPRMTARSAIRLAGRT
jgi:acetyltransferase-like isoleucine patch superfamily enzyme